MLEFLTKFLFRGRCTGLAVDWLEAPFIFFTEEITPSNMRFMAEDRGEIRYTCADYLSKSCHAFRVIRARRVSFCLVFRRPRDRFI